MSFLFKDKKNNNGVGKIQLRGKSNKNRKIIRQATFRIINTIIIYNSGEDYYETLATCVNENNLIETISLETFDIHENVMELRGAFIDYEEYEEDLEVNYTGTIYYL